MVKFYQFIFTALLIAGVLASPVLTGCARSGPTVDASSAVKFTESAEAMLNAARTSGPWSERELLIVQLGIDTETVNAAKYVMQNRAGSSPEEAQALAKHYLSVYDGKSFGEVLSVMIQRLGE